MTNYNKGIIIVFLQQVNHLIAVTLKRDGGKSEHHSAT